MSKKLFVFSSIFLSLLILVGCFSADIQTSENISNKVLRFHILANSDSTTDQELKLKVRDEILNYSSELFNNCKTVEDAIEVTKTNIDNFNQVAQKVIASNGYDYSVDTFVVKEYFGTRQYDNYTLPAGIYDSLKIVIGEGEGHNWWCVMFPTVCISSSVDDFGSHLTDEEKSLIDNDKYIVRFKAIEMYEKIKNKIK